MTNLSGLIVTAAVEGLVDEAAIRRILDFVGGECGVIHGRRGKSYLIKGLDGFNSAARFGHWVVLIDLDNDSECAAEFRKELLPSPSPMMLFRVAVRAIEAWLLADRERIAHFLGVSTAHVPVEPELIVDPKQVMIDLASKSRKRYLREDMVPRATSGRREGPAYTSRLIEFIADDTNGWRPDVAAQNSDSLHRCILRLKGLKLS